MKKIKKIFENGVWWAGVVMVGLVLGVSLQFVQAWTEPTQAPPGGNLGAPVNTGGSYQLKSGVLAVLGFVTNAFRMPTGAQNGAVLTSDAAGNGSWQPNGSWCPVSDIKRTGSSHDGNFYGYNGATSGYMGINKYVQDKCGSSYHACTGEEITCYYQTHDPNTFSQTNNSVLGWFIGSNSGDGSVVNDCKGFTEDSGHPNRGTTWHLDPSHNPRSFYPNDQPCNIRHRVMCCK